MANPKDIQEEQYRFPYHYLPRCSEGRFQQHEYWSWGYRYLGRLRITCELLGDLPFDSLVDIGCGDGRFLAEVDARFPSRRLVGVDLSEKAVALARQMNPGLCYEQRDILLSPPEEKFDVATLLEVIEHIRPEALPAFLAGVAGMLRPGGHIVLTAPHTNVKTIDKHYQHFNSATLRPLLAERFDDLRFVPFDRISWPLKAFSKAMGGGGEYYIVTHAGLSSRLFRYYLKHCLYDDRENRCHRIACVARKAAG